MQLIIVNLYRLFQSVSLAKRSFSVTVGTLASLSWSVRPRRGEPCSLWKRHSQRAAISNPHHTQQSWAEITELLPFSSLCASLGSSRPAGAGRGCPSLPLGRVPVRAAAAVPSAEAGAGRARGPGLGPAPRTPAGGAALRRLLVLFGAGSPAAGAPREGRHPAGSDGTRQALTAPWGTRGRGGRRWVRAGAAAGLPRSGRPARGTAVISAFVFK